MLQSKELDVFLIGRVSIRNAAIFDSWLVINGGAIREVESVRKVEEAEE